MTEGHMIPYSDFTKAMHETALAEGWRLSERDDDRLEIQREDETEVFPDDQAAVDFVAERGRGGSYMHQIAMHLDGQPYRRATKPRPEPERPSYPELREQAAKIGEQTILAINTAADSTVSTMPYKPQFILEQVIAHLQARV